MKKVAWMLLVMMMASTFAMGVGEARRRSPRRHTVSSYTRKDGTRVRSHTRGSGWGSSNSRRSRRSSGYSGTSSAGYTYTEKARSGAHRQVALAPQTMPAGSPAYTNTQVAAWSSEPGIGSDQTISDPGTMPTTGGAPLALSGFGSLVALVAFGLRRRFR